MELLHIEERFLRDSGVANALNLSEIKSIQRQMTNGQKKRFDQSLALGKIAVNAFNWFKSDEGKAKMNEEGISWTAEDFAGKVFGFKKSFFYKLVKAGQLEDQVIEDYRVQSGDSQTVEELLKFARQSSTDSGQDATEGGQDGEGSGQDATDGGQAQPEVVAQLSFKSDGLKFNVKVFADHSVKVTGADNAQIKSVLSQIYSQL
jgi:hypothetical protein